MRGKKWLLTVVCALLLVGVVCVLSNWLIDPFGVFEASPLQWDSYAQTLNPRGSKVRYISERPGEYDSFVVGSSSGERGKRSGLQAPLPVCKPFLCDGKAVLPPKGHGNAADL